MGQLDGKVALVTGSAHTIGKAIAIGMAREGANLVLADKDVSAMKVTEKAILNLGVQVEAVPTDVTKDEQIDNLFKKAMERFGRLDILVNDAGIFNGGPIDQLSTETWDLVIATNLRAPFLCTRAAFRIMKEQGGGRIINIGSISAQRVRIFNAPYSTAKFGLIGLTHTTALEGRQYGINCGILHPGNTQRDSIPAGMPPPSGPGVPGGPGGPSAPGGPMREPSMTPDEIAAAAVYMACLPPHVNVLELIQLPREQLYLGRG
jgi:NAD(P)-dependent dehydrogenase (short-subunit alcohol dehydrogenase family)